MTTTVSPWKKMLNRGNKAHKSQSEASPAEASHDQPKPEKWSLGVLNDRETDEVPGMFAHYKVVQLWIFWNGNNVKSNI